MKKACSFTQAFKIWWGGKYAVFEGRRSVAPTSSRVSTEPIKKLCSFEQSFFEIGGVANTQHLQVGEAQRPTSSRVSAKAFLPTKKPPVGGFFE